MKFYTGSPQVNWLWGYPGQWFVSNSTLQKYRLLRPVRPDVRWALDSGAFTELVNHGHWRINAKQYAELVYKYHCHLGNMDWAAPQDWLCIDKALQKTGLTVAEHQSLTIDSVLDLRNIIGDKVRIIPVLQGSTPDDYLRHIDQYHARGFDLTKEPTVGFGGVAYRQESWEIQRCIISVAKAGIQLHVFGFNFKGLREVGPFIQSADSMAWAMHARYKNIRLPGCLHNNCANCPKYAQKWTEDLHDYLAGKVPDLVVDINRPSFQNVAERLPTDLAVNNKAYAPAEYKIFPREAATTAQRICLVACSSKKRALADKAAELYTSSLFMRSRAWASTHSDYWFIVSARNGLVRPDEIIDPYDVLLDDYGIRRRRTWGEQVIERLRRLCPEMKEIILLTGTMYRQPLLDALRKYDYKVYSPLQGSGIGEQLAWLSRT